MLARRVILWFFAFMPVVWGNCPYWFVGYPPGDAREGAGKAVPRCPCCRGKVSANVPKPPRGCDDDCPMTIARRGATPVGTCVEAPPAQAYLRLADFDPVDGALDAAPEPLRIVRPPGPPPDDPASVVLLI